MITNPEILSDWGKDVVRWLNAVEQERIRQLKKWGHQPCESPWSDILMEEVGEVSKAKLEMPKPPYTCEEVRAGRKRMQEELVQVAAVAIAWAQALENGEA